MKYFSKIRHILHCMSVSIQSIRIIVVRTRVNNRNSAWTSLLLRTGGWYFTVFVVVVAHRSTPNSKPNITMIPPLPICLLNPCGGCAIVDVSTWMPIRLQWSMLILASSKQEAAPTKETWATLWSDPSNIRWCVEQASSAHQQHRLLDQQDDDLVCWSHESVSVLFFLDWEVDTSAWCQDKQNAGAAWVRWIQVPLIWLLGTWTTIVWQWCNGVCSVWNSTIYWLEPSAQRKTVCLRLSVSPLFACG